MKKNYSFVYVTLGIVLFSCNPLKKMIKNASLVKYEVKPNPIELKGEDVEVSVSGKFPAEYFNKKVKAVVTPVIKYPVGSATPTVKKLKPITLIGDKIEGEGTRISYEKGGSFTYTDKVAYEKEMETATVEFETMGMFKKKEAALPTVKAADGTIITQLLVKGDEKVVMAKDKFTRTTPVSTTAEIHYLVNTSNVRPTELKDADIKALQTYIDSADEKRITLKGITISAYASPEGEILRNDNLANERATSSQNSLKGMFKALKVEQGTRDSFYVATGKGEDWEGFRAELDKYEGLPATEKDMIVRLLQMYPDLDKREQEIKNLSKTYTNLADHVLPKLRRAQITLNGEKTGYSDDELKTLSLNSPVTLNNEELLYAATLHTNMNDQLTVYKSAAQAFPNDWRAVNNVGYIYFMQNKLSDAKVEFEKAAKLAKEGTINNNLGAVSRLMGDTKKAEEYYDQASGVPEASYNKGIISIMKGDYATAVSNLSGFNTFNLALAKLLNADPEGAMKTVDQSEEKGMAMGYYLKAIASVRKGSNDIAVTNLTEAINKDPKLKEKASKDAEFIKLREDNGFKSLVK